LKYIDKLIKVLRTDRNTFFTYLLTLASIYIAVDRIVEILFLCLSGISVAYWGPIKYTIAFACPVFAFLFGCASKYAKDGMEKFHMFILYAIMLYILALSMFVQWINQAAWLFLFTVPNYVEIVTKFYTELKRALCSIAIYLPVTTFFDLFWFIYAEVGDTDRMLLSILDYGGLNISKKAEDFGPYGFKISLGTDWEDGHKAEILEKYRFDPIFISGVSGCGKTGLLFEPFIASNIKQKNFFKESAKALGYTALKTGLADLNCPYNNDYINENFNLNMLTVKEGKEKLYKAYMHKILLDDTSMTYRNLGLTYMTPDYSAIETIVDVAQNFNVPYTLLDPSGENPIGINPFAYGTPEEVSLVISSILTNMFFSQNPTPAEAYQQNTASQAIENLSLLLCEMYPRFHEGEIATLEDILDMCNNFDLVIDLCKKVEEFPDLAKKYKNQLNYFKKYFGDTSLRKQTEEFIYSAINTLDSLLRAKGLRDLLCNRTNNINFNDALANGQVIFVCTRRGDLGPILYKAFALFFILSMQFAVLKRPGSDKTRIPHFLYIDDFSDFVCNNTLPLFTMYRKFKVGTMISNQNLSQLGKEDSKYRQTILSNSTTKFTFGDNSREDNEWWAEEFGYRKKWIGSYDYHIEPGDNHNSDYKNAKYTYTKYVSPETLKEMKFKLSAMKTKNGKGANYESRVSLDFLGAEFKEPHKSKTYDFTKFNNSVTSSSDTQNKFNFKDKLKRNKSAHPSSLDDDGNNDPIQSSSDLFFNKNSIIFDINDDDNEN
jgi:hypothetical protein